MINVTICVWDIGCLLLHDNAKDSGPTEYTYITTTTNKKCRTYTIQLYWSLGQVHLEVYTKI